MQIARPASGFTIVERPLAQQALVTARPHCAWLDGAYSNVKQRLRIAGHKIGHPAKGDLTRRIYIEADPVTYGNRLAVAYDVLADTITIYSLKILI